jgi:cell division septal protein FtsQ
MSYNVQQNVQQNNNFHADGKKSIMAHQQSPKPLRFLKTALSAALPLRFLVAVVVTGILLTIVAVRWQSTRKASRVTVSGATLVPAHEILDIVNIAEDSLTISALSFSEIEHRVKRHPFVKTVSAFRSSGDAIIVQIEERVPVAHVLYRGKQFFTDNEGVLLPYRLLSTVLDVPMISFTGRSVLDSSSLSSALHIIQALEAQGKEFSSNISEVQVRPNRECVLITTASATPVLFGTATDIEQKIAKLRLFWKHQIHQMNRRTFTHVDIRWSGQVVVRLSERLS